MKFKIWIGRRIDLEEMMFLESYDIPCLENSISRPRGLYTVIFKEHIELSLSSLVEISKECVVSMYGNEITIHEDISEYTPFITRGR